MTHIHDTIYFNDTIIYHMFSFRTFAFSLSATCTNGLAITCGNLALPSPYDPLALYDKSHGSSR